MNFVDKLFLDYEASTAYERINQVTAFFLGVLLLGIYNNIPSLQPTATIFFIMLIVWGFISVIETATTSRAKRLLVVYGVGRKFWLALFAGLAFGFILHMGGQAIILPAFASVPNADLAFLFTVIVAPFVEANFFRGLIMGTLYEYLGYFGIKNSLAKGGFALFGQAIAFAWFHTIVIMGGSPSFIPTDLFSLTPYFVFGVIAGLGVLAFKSIGFEYGLHGANNLLVFLGR